MDLRTLGGACLSEALVVVLPATSRDGCDGLAAKQPACLEAGLPTASSLRGAKASARLVSCAVVCCLAFKGVWVWRHSAAVRPASAAPPLRRGPTALCLPLLGGAVVCEQVSPRMAC